METKSAALSIVCGEIAKDVWVCMVSVGGVVTKSTGRHSDAIGATRNALSQLMNDDLSLALALEGHNVDELRALAQGHASDGS